MVFFCYSTVLVIADLSNGNFVNYFSTTLPFVMYLFIKNIYYEEKLESLFNLNYFFLSIVVFYGIYEYFYAQDFLRQFCVQISGRTEELNFPYNFFYRSVSFVMNYVHFSEYGLLCCFIAFVNFYFKPSLKRLLLFILSILGLISSVGFSAIAILCSFTVTYAIIFGKLRQKIGTVFFLIVLSFLFVYLYNNYKDTIGLFQRINQALVNKETGHTFITLSNYLSNFKFFGNGSFFMEWENEYFDAWQRFGVPMGMLYLCLAFSIYYKILKITVLFKEMRVFSLPLLFYCLALILIGFAHHTIDQVNQNILVFAFIAMIENRYKIQLNKTKPLLPLSEILIDTPLIKDNSIGFAKG